MQSGASGVPVYTIGALLAVGVLALLAIGLVVTVLVASRHSLVAWQKLKAALAVLIWVVPAGALIGWIAQRSDRHFVDFPAHPAQVGVAHPSHGGDVHSPGGPGQPTQVSVSTAAPGGRAVSTVSHDSVATMPIAVESEETAPRLKVRRISSDDPRWGEETRIVEGRELHSISSQRFATLAEAEEQATQQLLARIQAHFQSQPPIEGSSARLVELANQFAVKDFVGEVIDKYDFGNGITAKMYRAHVRFDFSPQLHDALSAHWRRNTVEHRIGILGGMLGLVTMMLGTAAGYFRLDDATGGKYRTRLKLAAALVVAAGGLATTAFVG